MHVSLLLAVALVGQSPALPRSAPEAQGIASSAILNFINRADKEIDAMHSVILVRHGNVVAEGWWAPYSAESRHELYSLSKSFTSTAVGLAVAEGKLSVDDEVLKFFPDDAPENPSANLKSMRVSDLLRMSTGHQSEPSFRGADHWAKAFLAHPVPFKPGTHFLYNTSATYMQSAIVQKATGETVLDFLRPRLFEPLGITDPTWGTSPQGVTLGGYGLSLRTEEIARFGQLLLQKGRWQGKQLVPAAWVDAATRLQTSNGSNPKSDWDQGYGYQFWRCRNGAFRGDGAFGQYCVVMPEQDAVLVITSGVKDLQAVLNLVWETLLPAMKEESLPADESGARALKERLAGLTLPTVKGETSSAAAGRVAGKTYAFETNPAELESLTLERAADGATTLVLRVDGKDQRVPCPAGAWAKARAAIRPGPEQPVAATGAWTSDDTFTVKICSYETPFLTTMKLTFEGDQLTHAAESNVGFGPTRQPNLVGKAK